MLFKLWLKRFYTNHNSPQPIAAKVSIGDWILSLVFLRWHIFLVFTLSLRSLHALFTRERCCPSYDSNIGHY